MTTNKLVCPACNGRGWDTYCQNESRPTSCPDCEGTGCYEHWTTVQEGDSAVSFIDDVLGGRS